MSRRDRDIPAPVPTSGTGEVAIIGMAGIFPRAPEVRTFWQNIVSKVDAIGEPPEDSLTSRVYDPASTANNRIYCKRGGYVTELPPFRPADFGIMPVAVEGAEPEHFLALQVAHDALVDAGFPDKPFNRAKTEVILGRGTFVNRAYLTVLQHVLVIDQTIDLLRELHPEHTEAELAALKERLHASLPPFNADTAPGLPHSVMAGIIANRLDLQGPCLVLDAACASSLLALEIAMADLQSGRCDVALIGGVQISTGAPIHMLFTQLGALSHLDHLRPFDKSADGTMLGEGLGMMVLKRREDAVRDGHRIYALVKGVGSSSDGKGKGLLAPQVEGEVLSLSRAYAAAGIDPQTIGLIEAHGTALPLGDVTEIQALRQVFGGRRPGPPRVALGTVKSMIGHLIPAAGIAGLIKTALALYHKVLPPTLHLEEPNPELGIEDTPFYFNTDTRPWIQGTGQTPRRAGVNAFGFGGINTHAILEEYPDPAGQQTQYHRRWDTELVVLEGEDREELRRRCAWGREFVARHPGAELVDLAYSLNRRREGQPCRLALVAASPEDLGKKLEHAARKLEETRRTQIKDRSGIYFFEEPRGMEGRLAFLFPGEGSQYPGMLQDLCLHFQDVRACFDLLDRAFADHPRNYLPSQIIFPPTAQSAREAEGRIWQLDGAVDAVITADRALFRLLTALGLTPQGIVGHSSGELMALEAAGAVSLAGDDDLVRFIQAGNRMMEQLMAAQEIPEASLLAVGGVERRVVEEVINQEAEFLALAMDNCPHQVVLCGTETDIAAAARALRDQGAICQRLPFRRAYHTERFRAVLGPLEEFFRQATVVPPAIPLYSCMTAGPFPREPEAIMRYAVEQWARPVRFQETIETMYADGFRIFVEVGPRSNLTGFVTDILKGRPALAVSCDAPHRTTLTQLQHALGLLMAHGVPVNLEILFRHRASRDLEGTNELAKEIQSRGMRISRDLPVLQVKREDFPEFAGGREASAAVHSGVGGLGEGPLLGPGAEGLPSREIPAWDEPGRGRPESPPAGDQGQPGEGQPAEVQAVMQAHWHTMSRFLETQAEVMRAYLRGAREFSPSQADLGREEAIKAEESGTPEVSIPSPVIQPSAPAPAATPTELGQENLTALLLSLISDKTGYPVEMLEPHQNLEADLGIDSIKRLEILGALVQRLGVAPEATERLGGLRTVAEIVACLVDSDIRKADSPTGSDRPPARSAGEGRGAGDPDLPPVLQPGGSIQHLVPGREVTVIRTLDLAVDVWLRDHTLGGRVSQSHPDLLGLAVVPLSMSLEMLAAAASLLTPGQNLVGLKNISVQHWLALPDGRLELTLTARRLSEAPGEIEVVLETAAQSPEPGERTRPAVTGTMVFAPEYPSPPPAGDFYPGEPLAAVPESAEFYPRALFHGPAFRCVRAIRQAGKLGLEAELQTPPGQPLSGTRGEGGLQTDPVLLDGAGQVVGLWAVSALTENFVIFPRGIEEIRLYAPLHRMAGPVRCQVTPRLAGPTQIRSEVRLLSEDGALLATLTGLVHQRAQFSAQFHDFRGSRQVLLSRPWPLPEQCPDGAGQLVCRRVDPLPLEADTADGRIWLEVLAHIILDPGERRDWANLRGPARRRQEWLSARLAGKEAVRCLLRQHHGLDVWPADIEIYQEARGKPRVRGGWLARLTAEPEVSLSHSGGVAVALAATGAAGVRVGIDLEALRRPGKGFTPLAFDPEEERLLMDLGATGEDGWHLRFWCAKEAVAKALGTGLPHGPREVKVVAVPGRDGTLSLKLTGKLAQEFSHRASQPLQAFTAREGDIIVASVCWAGDSERNAAPPG